jgi:hypothetical protein
MTSRCNASYSHLFLFVKNLCLKVSAKCSIGSFGAKKASGFMIHTISGNMFMCFSNMLYFQK